MACTGAVADLGIHRGRAGKATAPWASIREWPLKGAGNCGFIQAERRSARVGSVPRSPSTRWIGRVQPRRHSLACGRRHGCPRLQRSHPAGIEPRQSRPEPPSHLAARQWSAGRRRRQSCARPDRGSAAACRRLTRPRACPVGEDLLACRRPISAQPEQPVHCSGVFAVSVVGGRSRGERLQGK
jgi:hypothetical protein